MALNKIKLFVGTPVHSEVSIHYFKASLEFQKECYVRKIPVMFQVMKSSLVTQGRQLCVASFLNSQCTHLLFVDSDISYSFKMFEKMLNYDKDICMVPYPIKSLDFQKIKKKIKNTFKGKRASLGEVDQVLRRSSEFEVELACNGASSDSLEEVKSASLVQFQTEFKGK